MLSRLSASSERLAGIGQLRLDLGGAEVVKWIALALMIVDHVNAYLLDHASFIMYGAGRVAYPLFAVAFGASLAGRDFASMGRAFKRTLAWALVAQIASGLVRDPAPFNILFQLAAGVLLVQLGQRKRWTVLPAFVGALMVAQFAEFSAPGLLVAVAGIYYGRRQTLSALVPFAFSVAFLEVQNGNPLALLAIPVLFVVARSHVALPRVRNLFQFAYVGQFPVFYLARVFS